GPALDQRPHQVVGIDLLPVAEHPAPSRGGVAQAGELPAKSPRLRTFAPHEHAAVVADPRLRAREDDAAPAAQEAASRVVPLVDADAAVDGSGCRGRAGTQAGVAVRLVATGTGRAGIDRIGMVASRRVACLVGGGAAG